MLQKHRAAKRGRLNRLEGLMISFTMRGAGWGLVVAALLAACGSGGGGGGGGGDGGGTTYDLPAYTIAIAPSQAPVTNADGSVRFYDHTHIELAEVISGTSTTVKMTVTGIFNASRVFPVLFATTLGSGTDGWVMKFERDSVLNELNVDPCITESCSPSRPQHTASGTYGIDSEFSIGVEVDCSASPDIVRIWTDSPTSGTADYESSAGSGDGVGTKLGLSLEQATIRSIQVAQE